MAVCGLSPHQGSTESRKTQQQKFVYQIGTLNPHGINERDRCCSYFMTTLTMYKAGVGNANRITVNNWRLLCLRNIIEREKVTLLMYIVVTR